jgi:hypothetical protein
MGFALLENGDVALMYQSRASVDADLGESGAPADLAREMAHGTSALFIEVEALEEVIDALSDVEVLVPRRRTFYGMDEIFVRPPCGTVVGFAARVEAGEA